MPYYLQCTNAGSVNWAGFLQWLYTHHCIRTNARKLNTSRSLTANTEVASLILVHYLSSLGALQAKLLVQTQIPHFTPRSYKLQPTGSFLLSRFNVNQSFDRADFFVFKGEWQQTVMRRWRCFTGWSGTTEMSVSLSKGNSFSDLSLKYSVLKIKGNSTSKKNLFNHKLLPPPESMKY